MPYSARKPRCPRSPQAHGSLGFTNNLSEGSSKHDWILLLSAVLGGEESPAPRPSHAPILCSARSARLPTTGQNTVCVCVCVCVFIKLHITTQSGPVVCVCVFCHPIYSGRQACGRTSRGHTRGRSHRISPPSFCGACLNFSREKDSAVPFPRRP